MAAVHFFFLDGLGAQVGVKGAIKHVWVERVQEPFAERTSKHGRLELHVERGPPKQKIKRLMTKKELEGNIDVAADVVMCKHPRGKPKLCLVVDGRTYPGVEQCYITGTHPSASRYLSVGCFADAPQLTAPSSKQ